MKKIYHFETYVTKKYWHEIEAGSREEADMKYGGRDFVSDYDGVKVVDIDVNMVKAEDVEEESEVELVTQL